MLSTVLDIDGVTGVEILVKTGAYAACLAAAGSALARLALSRLDDGTARTTGRLAVAAAVAGAALSVARIPVRASFLMGGTLSGAFEPPIVAMVVESPLGASLWVRLAGLALVCAVAVNRPAARIAAGLGAGLVCASFALRGHTLEEPASSSASSSPFTCSASRSGSGSSPRSTAWRAPTRERRAPSRRSSAPGRSGSCPPSPRPAWPSS